MRECDRLLTRREHRAYPGFHLDLFGTTERPPVQARYSAADRLWLVYACAWRSASGPWAEWRSVYDGLCETSTVDYHFAAERPCADSLAELGRAIDLIAGRSARPGRPSRWTDGTWKLIAERAESLKRAHPRMPYWQIARRLDVAERTLRVYLAEYRREYPDVGIDGPVLLSGGRE